jgi:segregation and condensation protein A
LSDKTYETEKNEEKIKYNVKLREFEGPLDLLLHLVKNSEINIYDIPIAEITKQYLNYLALLVVLDLDNISEFVEMASTLVLIKSKTMLPIEVEYDEDDADPREELIAKLLEYQKYKIAAGLLDSRANESMDINRRDNDPVLFDLDEEVDSNWKSLSVIDLISAFAKILNNKETDTSLEVTMFDFTVEDKINFIIELLDKNESFNYFDIIAARMSKIELVCTFLAILELVKQGKISVRQHIIFGDIHIVKRKPKINVEQPEEHADHVDINPVSDIIN